MNKGISVVDLKNLAKKKGVEKITRLTTSEYKELLLKANSRRKGNTFHFTYNAKKEKDCYIIELNGRHHSTNDINGGSFKRNIAYKKAIKNAVHAFVLTNREKFVKIEGRAEIIFIFMGPHKRDYDNNYGTTKILQDSLTVQSNFGIGIIEDDTMDFLCPAPNNPIQIKTKEYKVIAIVYPENKRDSVISKKMIQYPELKKVKQ